MADDLTFSYEELAAKEEYIHDIKDGWKWNWFTKDLIPPTTENEEDVVDTIPENLCHGNEEIDCVVIPDTIKYIEANAFSNMPNLGTVMMSNKIETIGESAFENCTSLYQTFIPQSCVKIDNNAFAGCIKLNDIDIAYSTLFNHPTLGTGIFKNTGFVKIAIPGSYVVIPEDTFSSCHNLKEVYLGYGVHTIDLRAFRDCENLKKVTATRTITYINGMEEAKNIDVILDMAKPYRKELKEIWQEKLDTKTQSLKMLITQYLSDKSNTENMNKMLNLKKELQEMISNLSSSGVDLADARETTFKVIAASSNDSDNEVINLTPSMLEVLMTSIMYQVNDRVAELVKEIHNQI